MKRHFSNRVFGLVLFAICVPVSATAAPLLLVDPGPFYKQQENRPCVIGDPSCSNGTWDYGLIPSGPITEYSIFSDANDATDGDQPYTVGVIRDLKGDLLNVGIDVNTDGNPVEKLLEFFVYINCPLTGCTAAQIAFSYTGTVAFIGPNNGTGRSDAMLTGIDLSSYAETDLIQFFAHVSQASDGREQFFLIGANEPPDCLPGQTCPPPCTSDCDPRESVPEPGSLVLFGTAAAVGAVRKWRRKT